MDCHNKSLEVVIIACVCARLLDLIFAMATNPISVRYPSSRAIPQPQMITVFLRKHELRLKVSPFLGAGFKA